MTKRTADIWRGRLFYAVERTNTPDGGMDLDCGTVYTLTLWGARRRARRWTRSRCNPRYVETWP